MLVPLLLLLQASSPPPTTYDGRAGQIVVRVPRREAEVVVDGTLDDPAWAQAAVLRGFSQYLPADGLPAADSTVVLVFYTRHALYFGIRAYEAHGPVHATLANRDQIAADDYVQIFLDTSHDHRHAYVFGVNPLGIQADGILSEGIQSKTSGVSGPPPVRDTIDYSTDYTYESRGRVTEQGYEVAVRIPFSSIGFASGAVQRWGINIVRQVQHSGYQNTWAPARLANASFIAQSGTLDGMVDLSRGRVFDVNPELTSRVEGEPTAAGWRYGVRALQPGGNVRLGLTDNLTAGATIRPDFSQVESDVPQLIYDPRYALFFPEKRPFFLDGLEQFDTPNSLVYTRQIVRPDAAVKLTGELEGATVGLLSAADATTASTTGTDHPIFNILRVRRNVGGATSLGLLFTDREDGSHYNHVVGADARVLFGGIYDVRLQGAVSATHTDSTLGAGPLWDVLFERNGHQLRLNYQLTGYDPRFTDQSGYVARTGIVNSTLDNAVTFFGTPHALIESYTFDFTALHTWVYRQFLAFHRGEDIRWHFSNVVTLRGGWSLLGNVFFETWGYDPTLYANYAIARKTATRIDTVPYTGTPDLPNIDVITGITTPRWSGFDGTITVITGKDDNFYEWSSAWILFVNATIDWRPNDRLRASLIYTQQQYVRRSDNTQVAVTRVPYVEVAYQLSRPLFIRFIGQYNASWRAALRDDSRTNDPILIRDPTSGRFTPALKTTTNAVGGNWLFSYQPTPGTVFYLGYSSNLTEPYAFNFTGLRRTSDALFVKLTYLFHLGTAR